MKILVVGDLHLTDKTTDRKVKIFIGDEEIEISENLKMKLDVLNEISDIAREKIEGQEKHIIMLGDLKHKRQAIENSVINVLIDYFKRNEDIQYHIITGNHDISVESETAPNYLSSIERTCDNVEVVKSGEIKRLITKNLYALGYTPNIQEQLNELFEIVGVDGLDKEERILFGHFATVDTYAHGHSIGHAPIKEKDLKKTFKYTILGHYHKPIENGSIIYVGSIAQENWGEMDEEKRVMLLDITTNEFEFIPLTKYKKHIKIRYEDHTLDEIKKLKEQCILKVICRENDDVESLKKINVDFVKELSYDNFVENINIIEGFNEIDVMKEYLKSIGIDNNDEIKEKIDYVLNIIRKENEQ